MSPKTTSKGAIKLAQPPKSKSFSPLTLPALDFSLTAGTNIPSPPATPNNAEELADPNEIVRSPTPGGGPLSSHPTTPVMPGAFPSTPTSTELKANRVLGRDPSGKNDSPFASQSHLAPASSHDGVANGGPYALGHNSTVNTMISGGGPPSRKDSTSKKGSGMKRLFSFRSFYNNSNSSSADCFSGGAATGPTFNNLGHLQNRDSYNPPYRPSSSLASPSNRPDSPFTTSSNATGNTALRKKRSSAWFNGSSRRKSGLFMIGRVDENGSIASSRPGSGRGTLGGADADSLKENREPPPTIPEVRMDTEIGGEELFRDIH